VEIAWLSLFSVLVVFGQGIALYKNFYRLPLEQVVSPLLTLKQVMEGFLIYFSTAVVLPPLLQQWLRVSHIFPRFSLKGIFWSQGLALFLAFLFFFLFFKKIGNSLLQKIWYPYSLLKAEPSSGKIFRDCLWTLSTWCLAFPLVTLIGVISDFFLFSIFHLPSYEQVAVRYLKNSLHSPETLFLALSLILIIAPFIEEFLFRGLFQTWIKQICGRRLAMIAASLLFVLFHLSISQGWGNISLGCSLFTLSLYLGFLYEKCLSLFPSIILHATFNAVNCLRILYLE
jgi:membrane protease YdiL (CAAX protease family)